jgi:hemolysin activation/secretion protein
MPGEKVGTSDFAVDTIATPAYDGYVLFDNYGSVYTGKNRVSFNVDANSLTGRGDKLSLSGLSTDGMGLENGRLAYGLPLSAAGLRGELALSQTAYQLGNTYQSLQANGTAQAVDATLTYPLRRIQAQTIEASLNLDYKNLDDKVNSTNTNTPKTSSAVTAGLHLRDDAAVFGFDGQTTGSITLTAGDLEITDGAAAALDAAGANTRGNYQKVNLALSRVSLLPASFSLTTSLTAQQSLGDKNLDGSEQMAVSGSSAVMAYPSGELIGTNATLLSLELSHPLPAFATFQSSLQLFANWGQASAAKQLTNQSSREISDVGIGWSGRYKTAFVKAQLAHRLDSKPAASESTAVDNFLMQVGMTF